MDWKVGLHIHNAAFFSTNRPPISSCVKAEIRRSESSRYRKRTKQEQRQRQLCRRAYRTAVVPANNQVSFLFHFSYIVVYSCITCTTTKFCSYKIQYAWNLATPHRQIILLQKCNKIRSIPQECKVSCEMQKYNRVYMCKEDGSDSPSSYGSKKCALKM